MVYWCKKLMILPLIFSWPRFLSYRNQSIGVQSKSMDWFLYDRDLRHERVKAVLKYQNHPSISEIEGKLKNNSVFTSCHITLQREN